MSVSVITRLQLVFYRESYRKQPLVTSWGVVKCFRCMHFLNVNHASLFRKSLNKFSGGNSSASHFPALLPSEYCLKILF